MVMHVPSVSNESSVRFRKPRPERRVSTVTAARPSAEWNSIEPLLRVRCESAVSCSRRRVPMDLQEAASRTNAPSAPSCIDLCGREFQHETRRNHGTKITFRYAVCVRLPYTWELAFNQGQFWLGSL